MLKEQRQQCDRDPGTAGEKYWEDERRSPRAYRHGKRACRRRRKVEVRRGKVRGRVNERRRCNLRFAVRTSGATNARTEGDTACEREDHRARRGVKGGVGNAGSVRAAGRATPLAAGAGRRSG